MTPNRCERCGILIDEAEGIVTVSCGLETPALKKLRADAVAARDALDEIALDNFDEDDIARICGLDRHIMENAALVFVYIDRKYWPDGAQAAWEAGEAAMAAFDAYSSAPAVPADLRSPA